MQTPLYKVDVQKKLKNKNKKYSVAAVSQVWALIYEQRDWKPGKNPLHFGGRCVDTEKNDPSFLMLTGLRECWQLSKQLSMQIHGSESVTQAANALRWEWPPANRATRKVSVKENSISYWNVWLLQGVKCSLHHWKHLPALGWFQYQTAAATGEKHRLTHWMQAWLGFYQHFIQRMMQNVIGI